MSHAISALDAPLLMKTTAAAPPTRGLDQTLVAPAAPGGAPSIQLRRSRGSRRSRRARAEAGGRGAEAGGRGALHALALAQGIEHQQSPISPARASVLDVASVTVVRPMLLRICRVTRGEHQLPTTSCTFFHALAVEWRGNQALARGVKCKAEVVAVLVVRSKCRKWQTAVSNYLDPGQLLHLDRVSYPPSQLGRGTSCPSQVRNR
jgi:hypothetical protein